MNRRWPEAALPAILLAAALLAGCAGAPAAEPVEVTQLIPADIPPGMEPQTLDEVPFAVEPTLRILRNPGTPTAGIAAVKIMVTSLADETLENVHAAVWLPEEVFRITPRALLGTNLDPGMWDVDLTPEQPAMGLLTEFDFADFSRRDEIIAAFNGDTRVRIVWDGGDVLFTFPAELWTVEVVEDAAP